MPFLLGEMGNLKAICFKYLSENLKAKKLFLYGFPIIFRLKGVAPKSDNHAGLLYKKKTKGVVLKSETLLPKSTSVMKKDK